MGFKGVKIQQACFHDAVIRRRVRLIWVFTVCVGLYVLIVTVIVAYFSANDAGDVWFGVMQGNGDSVIKNTSNIILACIIQCCW